MNTQSKLISAATIILLVIILVGIYLATPVFIQVFTSAEFALLVTLLVSLPIGLGLGLWLAVTEIQGRKRKHQRFAPTEQGYYEALLIENEEGQQLFIKPQDNVPLLVPHTYSPRIEINSENGLAQLAAPGQTQTYQQPQLETIIDELTPNALEFIFGLDPQTGSLAKISLPKAVHIQLLGASGQGKSRQATSILTQLTNKNDTNHLQLALVDCEGETTAPFQRLPHVRYLADEPKEAARVFRGLVQELERRDITKQVLPVHLIFVEEFLNLRRTMPEQYREQALEDYTTLALRGRKRGLFLFSIGQTAYTEKAIRDAQAQFLSSMAFAIKPTAARSAGFTNTELLNRLYSERRPGQFLLEHPAGDSILLAPYVDPRSVSDLLSEPENNYHIPVVESGLKATRNQTGNQDDRALEAKLAQVCNLLSLGTTNKADILLSVWGVKAGGSEKYKLAESEYKQIMTILANERIVKVL